MTALCSVLPLRVRDRLGPNKWGVVALVRKQLQLSLYEVHLHMVCVESMQLIPSGRV